MSPRQLTVVLALVVNGLAGDGRAADLFGERVAPVLKQRCVACHNPRRVRGGLDLTTRAGMLKGGDNGPVLVPGDSAKSLLAQVLGGDKPRMPKQGARLTAEEVADVRKWIDDGAVWPAGVSLAEAMDKNRAGLDWWALQPLAKPALPATRQAKWGRNEIDAFILAGLEARGLHPSPEADRGTLIRRVTFDLTGLPPTPEEIEAFVADASPGSYEKVVDRLLASPRHGERWGRHWLDVAHYGDTHGYDKDKRRDHAWRYRDYVIASLNADKPYARFVREQIAGDVLFPEDPDGVAATGFLAAGPWDFVGQVELREGTVEKEKTRLLDRDDLVSTTVGTFLSLTAHCARCHDHKFDPIPQRDYYRLQAVFAGVERGDRPMPGGPAPRRAELVKRQKELEDDRAALLRKADGPELARLDAERKQLQADLDALPAADQPASPSNGYHSAIAATADVEKWVQVDLGKPVALDRVRLVPARPTDFPDTPGFGFPVRFRVSVSDDAAFPTADVVADHTAADFANPGDVPVVITLQGRTARYVRVTATRLWPRTGDYVFALAELQVESGGRNVARGAKVAALDSIEAGRWAARYLVDDFDSRRALPDRADPAVAERLRKRDEWTAKLRAADDRRRQLVDARLDAATRAALAVNAAERERVGKEVQSLAAPQPVYAVLPRAPRPIHVLHRGEVEQPRERVAAGALSCVPGPDFDFKLTRPDDEGARRVALAEWIADPRNPLTWRSIVNRVWHTHFGRGLVDTPNDFGFNGGRPSHPELLDWLAVTFRDGGGSLKRLHRLIVTSATYRQASSHEAAAAKIDADNRALWRMNRHRLDAEELRDTVLAVSGKLDLKAGGPGFELFRYKDDHSPVYDHDDLAKINDPATFRRTVYRFVVRSVPNPFLDCLDAADPNLATPARNTTLTALQALALLNDPFMIRQSEYFAERLQKGEASPERQMERAFRLALGRLPAAAEREALVGHVKKHGLASACRLLFNLNEFVFVD